MVKAAPAPGRQVPCEQCPLRTNPVFRGFSAEELAFISEFKSGEMNAEPTTTLYLEDTNSAHLYTLLSGWAFRYKVLPDGRRQILNFALPGDFLGLQASVINEMQHSVETLTTALLCAFSRGKAVVTLHALSLARLRSHLVGLARGANGRRDLLSVGRRTALERVAFVLLHLYTRAEDIGLARGNSIQFPFTQQHLADALGMSLVHTNKTIKRLFDRKIVRWKDKIFEILDRDELTRLALFDVRDKRPRPLI